MSFHEATAIGFADRNVERDAMHMHRTFVRFASAAAVAALATAAGPTVKVDRLAFAFDSCPFVATGGSVLLLQATSMVPLRAESGFECPINQLPSSS